MIPSHISALGAVFTKSFYFLNRGPGCSKVVGGGAQTERSKTLGPGKALSGNAVLVRLTAWARLFRYPAVNLPKRFKGARESLRISWQGCSPSRSCSLSPAALVLHHPFWQPWSRHSQPARRQTSLFLPGRASFSRYDGGGSRGALTFPAAACRMGT